MYRQAKTFLSRWSRLFVAALLAATIVPQIVSVAPASADDGGYPWVGAVATGSQYTWGYLPPCPSSDSNCTAMTDNGYGTADPWGYGLRNCTSYVAWKIYQVFDVTNITGWGNATTWDTGYTKPQPYPVYSGSNYTPQVGDIAQWDNAAQGLGHVAYVYAVNNGIASLGEYNSGFPLLNGSPQWGVFYNGRTTASTSAGIPDHYIHIGNASTATATSSQITPDGVQHLYTGDSAGTVYDISWGNGAPLVQWKVASLGGSVTAMSSQVVNGVQHVYAAVGAKIYDVSWGNGAPLTVWAVNTLSASIASISSQLTSDGLQHVYTSTGVTVQDTSWGNGSPVTTWQVGSFGSSVSALSSHVVSGVQHVYAAVGTTVQDISWGNGAPLVQWQVGNLGATVVGLTSQLISGVQHVDAATSTTVKNISWGNGAPLTVWQVGSVSGMTIRAVSSQITSDGVQHVYAGTSASSVYDISWGNGAPLVQWQVASSLGSAVVAITSQLMGGVQQVDTITSSQAWNISWGNGAPLTQWQVSAIL